MKQQRAQDLMEIVRPALSIKPIRDIMGITYAEAWGMHAYYEAYALYRSHLAGLAWRMRHKMTYSQWVRVTQMNMARLHVLF